MQLKRLVSGLRIGLKEGKLIYKKFKVIVHSLILIFLKFMLAYFYIGVISVGGLFLFRHTFFDRVLDTTSLTNIGFGIFAGIAGICFSWAKLLQVEFPDLCLQIYFQGERLFLGALLFLVASIVKYLFLQKAYLPVQMRGRVTDYFFDITHYIFIGAFFYAYFMATSGVYELFAILFNRHIRKPNIDILNISTKTDTKL